jgi:hypothetical protein
MVAGSVVAAALLVGTTGPAAYALETASTPHGGAIPSAGPAGQGGSGFGFGRPGVGGLRPGGPAGGLPGGAGAGGASRGTTGGSALAGPRNDGQPGRAGNGVGGLLDGSSPSAAVTTFLNQGAKGYTWVAATVRSNQAAGYQLATGDPIMSVGGFNGTDPYPTLAQFQQYVALGKIHYFIAGGGGPGGFDGPGGGGPGAGGPGAGRVGVGPGAAGSSLSQTARQIQQWVTATFRSTTVGGVTIYDLTAH